MKKQKSINEAPKWCGCPQSGGGITVHQVNGNCSTFCDGGFECTNPGCYKTAQGTGKKLKREAATGCRCKYEHPTTGATGVTNIGSACNPCTDACCKEAG